MIDVRFVVFLAKVNLDQVIQALGLPFIQHLGQIVGVDEILRRRSTPKSSIWSMSTLSAWPAILISGPPQIAVQNRRDFFLRLL